MQKISKKEWANPEKMALQAGEQTAGRTDRAEFIKPRDPGVEKGVTIKRK